MKHSYPLSPDGKSRQYPSVPVTVVQELAWSLQNAFKFLTRIIRLVLYRREPVRIFSGPVKKKLASVPAKTSIGIMENGVVAASHAEVGFSTELLFAYTRMEDQYRRTIVLGRKNI